MDSDEASLSTSSPRPRRRNNQPRSTLTSPLGESSTEASTRRSDTSASSTPRSSTTSESPSHQSTSSNSPVYTFADAPYAPNPYIERSYTDSYATPYIPVVRSPLYSPSPTYSPQSPTYSPVSPTYNPVSSPAYAPVSPHRDYSPPYSLTNYAPSPSYPRYAPTSPPYASPYYNMPSSPSYRSTPSPNYTAYAGSTPYYNIHSPSTNYENSPGYQSFSAVNATYNNNTSTNTLRSSPLPSTPQPLSHSSHRQQGSSYSRKQKEAELDLIFKRYFNQLTKGCSNNNCTSSYCASNPNVKKLEPNEAALRAIDLAKQGTVHICPHMNSDDGLNGADSTKRKTWGGNNRDLIFNNLQLSTLELLLMNGEARGDYSNLHQNITNVFSNSNRLAESFIQTDPQYKEQCPVDIDEVRKCYSLMIQKCPDKSINKALLTLLKRIKSGYESIHKENLHIFIIILQNPLLMEDPAGHSEVMPLLVDILARLPPDKKSLLCKYFIAERPKKSNNEQSSSQGNATSNEVDPDLARDFQNYVRLFQHFIILRLLSRSITPNKDEAVMDATKCLDMLHKLNEEKKFIPYTEFYNDAINEQIEIKEDLPPYKQRDGFSFCDYPFILKPAIKANILKIESMIQMRHELQDTFFRAMFIGVTSPYLVLEIRRDHIIRDALYQLESKSPQDLKKQLRVQFVGEEGVDEGGVQKEFFQLVVREMFDQKYGMFTQNEESRLCWFNQNTFVDELLDEYKLIGRLLGLAIYSSVILDVHFPIALYRKLKNQPVSLRDLKELDPTLGKGLEQLLALEDDVESTYNRTFQIEYESFGHRFTHELRPGGADIKLTNENRHEFVELFVDFWLNKSIERQFNAFKEGFDLVCGDSAVQLFRPEEVELLVCGSPDLDFEALESATQYDGGFVKDTPVIRHFWEIVHAFTEEQKKRLLFFATGSDRVPMGGLGKMQFVIAKNGGDSDRLPTSHTCYNVLLLCEYSSKEKLRERLLTAISNAEGFGLI